MKKNNIIQNNTKKFRRVNTEGFAMIFTVLIMSLILSITMGMSNIVFKQRILSGLVRDSQIAFYQADAGSECGLLQQYKLSKFTKGVPIQSDSSQPGYNSQFACGDKTMVFSTNSDDYSGVFPVPDDDYFVFQQEESATNPEKPCFTIVFDLRDPASTGKTVIDSRGYNICGVNIRQVERGIKVSY